MEVQSDESRGLPVVVAFGGGTNSTAMLCGFRERGIIPSLICFADTGGEMPHTYEHVAEMDGKCREWWGIGIEVVDAKYKGEPESLEVSCIRKKTLPSLAFGFKACSLKHKVDPQNKRVKQWMKDNAKSEVIRCIGYDAGENHRSINKKEGYLSKSLKERFSYPLIDWGWRRKDCVEAISRHGITQPGKSSCFFCPAMKRHEILKLRDEKPELYARAIAMESGMEVKGRVRGLSMGVPWSEIVAADDAQAKLFDWIGEHATPAAPCGCYDG